MAKECNARCLRCRFVQQLQSLGIQLDASGFSRQPRHVPARSGQTDNDPRFDQPIGSHSHDRNRPGRARGGTDARTDRNDDVDRGCNEVLHQLRKAIVSAFGGTAHHNDVPTLFASVLAQTARKRLVVTIACYFGDGNIIDKGDPRQRSRVGATSHQ
jgi:hypothetical protein